MADYVQDPNDSKKQVPGSPPDNYYDRAGKPSICTLQKTPNYVLIATTMTTPFGFFFGSSASFAALSVNSASSNYDSDWGTIAGGTRLDIHPTAWSGSSADDGRVRFIYKGGLDGQGRG